MSETVLNMSGITKVFTGVRALDNARIEVKKGEVHALVGENGAGKSTLMKILLGIYLPDAGEIIYKGKNVHFKNPSDALNVGISMIHQEMSLVSDMDVSENIWLGREQELVQMGFINKKKRYELTNQLLDELGIELNPKAKIKSLNVAKMQLVEIVRAVSYNSDIIIMDEPTSALTNNEVDILYRIVRDLAKRGVSIIFISHKLEEIFEICNRVTVMRDGEFVGTYDCEAITKDDLIRLIVGRENTNVFTKQLDIKIGKTALEVQGICSSQSLYDINFSIRQGEILGFSGLMGAGRTEVMRAIFGIDKYQKGKLFVNGKEEKIKSPKEAVKLGIAMITEDRLRTGAIYCLSVLHNATLSILDKIVFGIFLSKKQERNRFDEISKKIRIKYSSEHEFINRLSGGNQQKVLLARCLLTNPKILILDEPTRGIDVGSKAEIYRLIEQLASQGLAIILVSSELPELLSLCDRILVMRGGKIVHECRQSEATQEKLISYAYGTNQ